MTIYEAYLNKESSEKDKILKKREEARKMCENLELLSSLSKLIKLIESIKK